MDVVRVKCIDMSYSVNGAWDKKDIITFGLLELDIIGWLIEDRVDCLVIAAEHQPSEGTFRHLIAIPKVCIQEVIKLRKS